jgi:ferredoxin
MHSGVNEAFDSEWNITTGLFGLEGSRARNQFMITRKFTANTEALSIVVYERSRFANYHTPKFCGCGLLCATCMFSVTVTSNNLA